SVAKPCRRGWPDGVRCAAAPRPTETRRAPCRPARHSSLAHRFPLRLVPVLHGAEGRASGALHPSSTVDHDQVAGDITGAVGGEIGVQVGELAMLAEAAQRYALFLRRALAGGRGTE